MSLKLCLPTSTDFQAAADKYTTRPLSPIRTLAFDFETTGINLRHGDCPFMLAITFSNGEQLLWQAEIDPLTRKALWAKEDIAEIRTFFTHFAPGVAPPSPLRLYIGSNVKFDTRCLQLILGWTEQEAFDFLCAAEETIGMHHALRNNESHKLKDAAVKHGGISDDDESELHEATKVARVAAGRLGWAIASPASCRQVRRAPKAGWGVMDMWLPRQLALHYWRTSEAYAAWEQLKDLYKTFEWSDLKKAQQNHLKSQQGWEWHPPEVHDKDVHPWHTLCATYCLKDTVRSVTLYEVFKKELETQGLWEQYNEHRLNTVMSYRIEERGVSLNTRSAVSLRKDFAVDADYTKACAGYSISPIFPINPGSPIQLQAALYGDEPRGFALPITRMTKKGKSPSTDKDMLAEIIGYYTPSPEVQSDIKPPSYHPDDSMMWRRKMTVWYKNLVADKEYGRANQLYMFCASLLQYSKSNKGISQINSFLNLALDYDEASGFSTIYPSINPYGTKTTRQSSANPNGTNISKGGKSKESVAHLFKIKKTLRMLFGPRPGREWWSVDYTQIQLVIFAFMSGDERLIAAVLRGDDFHAAMARIIFGHGTDPSDPRYYLFDPSNNPEHAEQRDLAKNVNFAFLFGAQEAKLVRVSGMPGIYDLLSDRLPAVIGFLDRMEWEVRRHGYVTTIGGYRLYVPEDKAYSGSVYAIQGTEGEIVKRATYGVQDYLDRRSISDDFYITLPVHDELNFDSLLGYGSRHIGPVCQIMEDAALSYGIPCKVTPKLCLSSWAKGEKFDLSLEEVLAI